MANTTTSPLQGSDMADVKSPIQDLTPQDYICDRQHVDTLLQKTKHEFHNGRCLHLKHLPSDVTDEDIRELLHFLDIKEIHLNKRVHTARVVLSRPEDLDSWHEQTLLMKEEMPIQVFPSPTEHLLCVAHLPLIYTDDDFQNLVQMYGPVARCFLMRSEQTGNSKGYGFVEYTSKEVAHQAKNLLEQKSIGNCTLQCDWLEPSHVTYSNLHSKCLFVDHLPPDFRDVTEFRQIFSVIVNPIYCQVIMKNGQPLGIGLVEFTTAKEAEDTQQKLNGYQIHKFKIRVTFCIPGVHAMTLFNKLTMNHPTNGKKALLPDPLINPSLYGQLQLLAVQNPQFFQSLQSLVMNQLQNMQNNNQVHNNRRGDKAVGSKPALTDPMPLPPGLLGNPPPLSSNPNLQAAMVILLAAQVQNQMRVQQGQTFDNPLAMANLQTLLGQLQGTANVKASTAPNPNAPVSTIGGQNPQHRGFPPPNPNGFSPRPNSDHLHHPPPPYPPPRGATESLHKNGHQVAGRPALLPNPSPFKGGLLPTPPPSDIAEPPWDVVPPPFPPPPRAFTYHVNSDGSSSQNGGYGNRAPLLEKPSLGDGQVKRSLLGDKPPMNGSSVSPASSISSLTSEGLDLPPNGPTFSSPLSVSQSPTNLLSTALGLNTSPLLLMANGNHSPTRDTATPAALGQLNAQLERLGKHPLLGLLLQAAQSNGGRLPSMDTSPSTPPLPQQPPFPCNEQEFPRHPHPQQHNHFPKPSLLGSPPMPEPKGSLLGDYPAHTSNSYSTALKGVPMTNHKRKLHNLLPSPEQSPEGGYIGQHSQGIGGHYADSYFKKLRK